MKSRRRAPLILGERQLAVESGGFTNEEKKESGE